MCGIIGECNLQSNRLSKAMSFIAHRGPDSSGTFISKNRKTHFGHSRLAILDTTQGGTQPFRSDCKRFSMVYNGELYNYKDLARRETLSLQTSSDTEVFLKLFIRHGTASVKEMNGMFAAAIYDEETETTYFFRDRIGIKPLYYWLKGDQLAFSSELPALLELVQDVDIREESMQQFLHRGYIPEPHTLYQDIYKFPSGTYGSFKDGKLTLTPYWRAEDAIQASTISNETQVISDLEDLLRDSVRLRLTSDVPYGTFLSGGADSGLITALAADLSTDPLNTFNVSFEDAVFDESPFAERMAAHIGAKYHHIRMTKDEVMGNLEAGCDLVGEPFADSSVFPTMAVSQFASEHVKMVLSGDGGDELFMGYGAYNWADRMEKHWSYRKLLSRGLRMTRNARNKRAANVFDAPTKSELPAHIFSQEQNLFSKKEIEKMIGKPFKDSFQAPDSKRKLTSSETQAFFDLTNYLKDDLLVKVDRSTMHHSLEARVPFLDHRLVEYSLNIDPDLKRKNGESKYLVKKIMERYYPDELIYRKKWGFSIPLEKWMQDEGPMSIHPSFQKPYDALEVKYHSGDGYLYNRLYALKVLSRYL